MNEKIYKANFHPAKTRASSLPPLSTDSSMTSRYLENIKLAPGLTDLITPSGRLVAGSVKSASDFSYSAASYAGDGYRIIGDAGGICLSRGPQWPTLTASVAFIDPFFSSGVHLAMTSALSAAATICASIRRHCPESVAAEWHTRRVSTSYTRQVALINRRTL